MPSFAFNKIILIAALKTDYRGRNTKIEPARPVLGDCDHKLGEIG